ncbi:MAG: DUF5077 domain-containing protein [Alloprevotella sp.]|nr:DUF5077 domain-containing protein [Alloprevotella sp.]
MLSKAYALAAMRAWSKALCTAVVCMVALVGGATSVQAATTITVGTSTGTFYNITNNVTTALTLSSTPQYASKWTSTSTSPQLTLTCSKNDMVVTSSAFKIHTNTYTLTVPTGYTITGYSIKCYSTYTGTSTITPSGGSAKTISTRQNSPTTVSASSLDATSVSFTCSTGSPYITITSFTVTVESNLSWTIAAANNGVQGGYLEGADGSTQTAEGYNGTTWPTTSGMLPTYYIHFPAGSFTLTSAYGSAIKASIDRVSTETTLVSGQSASSFSFTAPAEEWYRLQLTGGTAGSTALKDFTVTATSAVTGTNTNVWLAGWRSIPSLHVWYGPSDDTSLNTGGNGDWAYNEVFVPTETDYLGTYYMAIGWGALGYFGMQNNGGNNASNNRTIIFSGWDNGDTDVDANLADYYRTGVIGTGTAETVESTRFGGEGTGGSVRLHGTDLWKAGQWVKFLTNTRPEQISLSDGTTYNNTLLSAWYWAGGVDTDWHYVGTIRISGQNYYFKPDYGMYSFLEEYTRQGTSQGQKEHQMYTRRFALRDAQTGAWHNLNNVSWSRGDAGTEDGKRHDNDQTLVTFDGEPAQFMQSGGYATMKYSYDSQYVTNTLTAASNYAPSDATLQALIERDVLPAIQQQDEDRMENNITAAMTEVTGWSVSSYCSQDEYEGNLASYVVDGSNSTKWQTAWASGTEAWPHWIVLTNSSVPTIEQIVLTFSDREDRMPASVRVDYSTNGSSWTEGTTYELSTSSSQTVTLESALAYRYIRLYFPEGNTATGTSPMMLCEVAFRASSLSGIQALAQSYVDNAGQFNYYAASDLTALQAVLANNESTYADYVTALQNLAANGTVLKYGTVSEEASISPEKAYVIRNKNGYGDMVVTSTEATAPTLRNGSSSYYETLGSAKQAYKTTYCTAQAVTDELTNWMFVSGSGSDEGYYYIYNMGAGKYLNHPGAGTATLSDTPVAFSVSYDSTNKCFNLRVATSSTDTHYICAAPQNADGSSLAYWTTSDAGSQWYLYDNYSVTPSRDLVEDLRVAAGWKQEYTLTWNVLDADDGTTVRATMQTTETTGTIIDRLPDALSAYDELFVNFADVADGYYPRFVVSGNTTKNLTTTYDLPFTPGQWYYVRLNGKLLSSTLGTNPLQLVTTSYNRASAQFPWKFEGNPFTGFTITPYSDASKYVYWPTSGIGQAPYLATDPIHWTIRRHPTSAASGAFQIKDYEANYAWYDYGGSNEVRYWYSDSGNDSDVATVAPVDVADELLSSGYYRITNKRYDTQNLTVDTSAGTLQVTSSTDKASTIFRVEEQSDGRFLLSKLGYYPVSVNADNTAVPVTQTAESAHTSEVYGLGEGYFALSIDDGASSGGDYGFANLNHWTSYTVLRWYGSGDDGSAWIFTDVNDETDVALALHSVSGQSETYATAYLPFSYTVPDGVQAMVVSLSSDGRTANVSSLPGGYVPEGTPVLLVGDGDTQITLTSTLQETTEAAAALIEGNALQGTYVSLAPTANTFVFNSVGAPGFYRLKSSASLAPYKAYLEVDFSGVRSLVLNRGDGTTSIVELPAAEDATATPTYDLQGRRVSKAHPAGLYIQGGRKVISK